MSTHFRPLAADPDVSRMVRFKAKLLWEIRKYLHDQGGVEIPMPLLQRTREGAPIDQWSAVNPHTGQRWYLRHCMEDHLRRVSAAHPRVFEIGKAIRADAASPMHAHEFVVLELVFRGLGFDEGVTLVKGLLTQSVAAAADAEYGNGEMFRGVTVRKWDEVFEEATGLAAGGPDFIRTCESWLRSRDIIPARPYTVDWEVLEDVMKYVVEPACVTPTIITYFPRELQHVCDVDPSNGRALRLSSVLHGVEMSDGGVKFAGSADYRRIYAANAEYRHKVLGVDGNDLPEEFFTELDALNEPAFTTGMGIDRITALVAGCDIRRALIFPEG